MLIKSDTKLGRKANILEDRNRNQNYLDRLNHWSENRMEFNIKCKVLHQAGGETNSQLQDGDTWLSNTMNEKDFEISLGLLKGGGWIQPSTLTQPSNSF